MKVSKRSLIVSIAVLCVCALSLTAASFAWFTSSTTAKVDTLNMYVEQRSSLEISITGEDNWTKTLIPKDFVDADLFYVNGEETTELNDASTNNCQSWVTATYDDTNQNFDFAAGAVQANKNSATADYLYMPISFRASQEGTVSLVNPNFAVVKAGLKPALRVGVKIDGVLTIYGGRAADEDVFYQTAQNDSDNFANRTKLTTTYKPLTDLDSATITLDKAEGAEYATNSVEFFVWIEGSDDACIDVNSGTAVTAGVSFNLTPDSI